MGNLIKKKILLIIWLLQTFNICLSKNVQQTIKNKIVYYLVGLNVNRFITQKRKKRFFFFYHSCKHLTSYGKRAVKIKKVIRIYVNIEMTSTERPRKNRITSKRIFIKEKNNRQKKVTLKIQPQTYEIGFSKTVKRHVSVLG